MIRKRHPILVLFIIRFSHPLEYGVKNSVIIINFQHKDIVMMFFLFTVTRGISPYCKGLLHHFIFIGISFSMVRDLILYPWFEILHFIFVTMTVSYKVVSLSHL